LETNVLIAASFQLTSNDPGLDAGLILVRIQEVMERVIVVRQLVGLDMPMKRPWQDAFFLIAYNDTKSYHKNSTDTFLGVGDEVFAMRWNAEAETYCPIYHKAVIKQMPSTADGRVMLLYKGDAEPNWVESATRIDPFGITPVIIRRVCIKKTQEYNRVVKPLKKKRKLAQKLAQSQGLQKPSPPSDVARINQQLRKRNPPSLQVNSTRATTKIIKTGSPMKRRLLSSSTQKGPRSRNKRRSSATLAWAKNTKRQRTSSPVTNSQSSSPRKQVIRKTPVQEPQPPKPTIPVDENGFRYMVDPTYKIPWPKLDLSLHTSEPLIEPIVKEQFPLTPELENEGYMSALGLFHRWDQMKQIQSGFTADSFL
jgi:hypothetical protein